MDILRLLLAIMALQVVSSMRLKAMEQSPGLNGKAVIRYAEESIIKDREGKIRVPVQFADEQNASRKVLWIRTSNFECNLNPEDFQVLADCYKVMDADLRRALYRNGKRQSDDKLLRMLKEVNPMLIRAILIDMTAEELDAKHNFVRQMGAILFQDAPKVKVGKFELRLAMAAIEADAEKMRIVSSIAPFVFCDRQQFQCEDEITIKDKIGEKRKREHDIVSAIEHRVLRDMKESPQKRQRQVSNADTYEKWQKIRY